MTNKLKYIIIFLLISYLSIFELSAKTTVDNDWINYNQQYFKIHVSQDGIYKIPYSQLLAAGIPVNLIDPRGIQIFYNGEEQYIYIHGENSSGIFDPNSYIEFYGKRNRGEIDLDFFDNSQSQVNPDYSFFSDTSAYFITWNFSTSNRRMQRQNSTDYNPYIPYAQKYCFKNIRTNYTAEYYWGSSQSYFTSGEGWFDNIIIGGNNNNIVKKTIQTPNYYSLAGNARVEIAVAGVPASKYSSSIPHHLKVDFLGETRINQTYNGYEFVRQVFEIPSSQLSNSILFTFASIINTSSEEKDRNAVAYIDIKYPYSWNFQNLDYIEFYLSKNTLISKDYVEITGFNSTSNLILYDISNHERIDVQNNSGTLKALVNHTNTERFLVLANQSGYKSVDKISKISSNNKFTDYLSQNTVANYIIITHNSLLDACQQYATYRRSTGYNVVLVDVDQLYDQFAYGVNKHPAAIRRYAIRLYELDNRIERTMFLVGKSIHSRLFRKSTADFANCLVPSAGHPSSDNLLTAGIGPTYYEPLFGTGRLSVLYSEEVISYLDKIIAYESNNPAEWMKYVMHFGGGKDEREQTTFASYLNNYKSIIEDTLYGGSVKTFLKTSSEPIQIAQSDSVSRLINNGVSMITFFGHGSSSGFDQNIDFPSNYNNTNKYPFILANSCFSGDIHQTSNVSISEQWINIRKKGAIAFLATVGQGYPTYLNVFATEFYKNISYKKYNHSISWQIINTIKNIQPNYLNNVQMEINCHEFTLNGDPALSLNAQEKPDLVITSESVTFIPNEINTVLDSFDVKIVIKNIGKAVCDTFLVYADRLLPNGTNYHNDLVVFQSRYSDTLLLRLPVDRLNGPGLNSIKIFVDANNDIDEFNEMNNEVRVNFFVKTSDLFPVYPYKYSIYPNKQVSLIASTGDPFIDNTEYKFQIDTTDNYNSVLLNQTVINSVGGIVSWLLPFDLVEGRVYYWRIAKNHINSDSIVWKESSFIYEEGQEGWSQAHYYQFKEDDYQFINYNRTQQKFTFVDVPKRLSCHNTGSVWTGTFNQIGWNLDGAINNGLGDVSNCGTPPAMLIAVIDPTSLLAWPSDIHDYGHRNYPMCWSSTRPQYYFSFSTDNSGTVNVSGLQAMTNLLNSVPNGYYILAYSWSNAYFQNWPEQVYNVFENLGSTIIRDVPNNHPYIFFTKKGSPVFTKEVFGNSVTDEIDLPATYLSTDFSYGKIKSVEIGPSLSWESLHWMQESVEQSSNDQVYINVYGLNSQGQENLLINEITTDNYNVFSLNDSIDYNQYPKLKLDFYTKDEVTKTPAQLKKWQVKFAGVPETVIDPKLGFYFCCDTIYEGDEIKFAIATKNITTNHDMDSLVVKYWIQDDNNEITVIDERKLRSHPAGDLLIDTINYSSINLSGINSIWVEYNPINIETGIYYQPEQYHFNNIAVKYFYVQRDVINPLLDVSFDGRYIMNGEIVSSKPEIRIKLKDENKYLALNDTSLFRIYLTNLTTLEEKRIYFMNSLNPGESIEWIPASLPENSCQIIYKPIFTDDGLYRLRVQAKDVSENMSGFNDYVIDFEVITTSSITQLLNYPNPFSTSTRFVFELTGSEIPDDLRIEIFTVTGKLVKVIFLDELGPLRIGKNITEYAWDGKDMYGDRLANGVYFYQVKAKINGKEIDKKATEADKYFKKEIGKMYLIN